MVSVITACPLDGSADRPEGIGDHPASGIGSMSDENASDDMQTPVSEQASEEFEGFETIEQIRKDLLPQPSPTLSPDDPATALDSIDDWNETWLSLVDDQDSKTIALSSELEGFIERTNYLARWCESVGLDSTALIEFSHAARDTYYAFRPSMPRIPDAVWVLLERVKYRLQPFTVRPVNETSPTTGEESREVVSKDETNTPIEPTSATGEVTRRTIPKDEAEFLVGDFLKKNPGATASQVASGVGIAQGRLPGLASWRAEQGRRKASRMTTPKTIRRLTKKMAESIGRTNDPSAHLETREVAWEEMVARAGPREKIKLLSLTKEERSSLIDTRLRQVSEDFDDSDDDS